MCFSGEEELPIHVTTQMTVTGGRGMRETRQKGQKAAQQSLIMEVRRMVPRSGVGAVKEWCCQPLGEPVTLLFET